MGLLDSSAQRLQAAAAAAAAADMHSMHSTAVGVAAWVNAHIYERPVG
jgi:hypothetical protein